MSGGIPRQLRGQEGASEAENLRLTHTSKPAQYKFENLRTHRVQHHAKPSMSKWPATPNSIVYQQFKGFQRRAKFLFYFGMVEIAAIGENFHCFSPCAPLGARGIECQSAPQDQNSKEDS